VQTRAERLELTQGKISGVVCVPVAINGAILPSTGTHVRARHVVVAGGAINSPALMLRSGLPDPHHLLGRRTFLHPTVASSAIFDERIEAWDGAPQTIYTDHFLETAPVDGPIGYKLEAPPLYPVLSTVAFTGIGAEQADALKQFPHIQALLALLRDGFHEQSAGGQVKLRADGSPVLDYVLTPFVLEGARRALLSMVEIQFAAGAKRVKPVHEDSAWYTSWAQAKGAIAALRIEPYRTRVFSAHVMGGCGMAGKEELGVVRPDGRHWQVENLSVHDGSLFPTSVGANPQLSIYGLVNMLATGLARALSGRDVRLA
jgi:choline dehydrogenase-like flavoprotein